MTETIDQLNEKITREYTIPAPKIDHITGLEIEDTDTSGSFTITNRGDRSDNFVFIDKNSIDTLIEVLKKIKLNNLCEGGPAND